MSTHAYCVCPRGSNSVRGIARGPKADEVLVTVHNDGVVCYNTTRQVSLTSSGFRVPGKLVHAYKFSCTGQCKE